METQLLLMFLTRKLGNKWHQVGLEHGGVSIEDPPGIREFEDIRMYLAYLKDPSGNKICAIKVFR